jgi:hypothetical protein
LDADTKQPVCFTTAVASTSVAQATPALLDLAQQILNPMNNKPLVVADTEHYTAALIDHVYAQTPFDLLVPMPRDANAKNKMENIPAQNFVRHWAGFAVAKQPYRMTQSQTGPHVQFVQRTGEKPEDYQWEGFLGTSDRDEIDDLTLHFPKRWHIEEFFNANQALGWQRAGTLNLNIRYGQMTMALIAQTVLHQFRERVGSPFATWDAKHMAHSVFCGIDGDIRVFGDTIMVTFYNAPNVDLLRDHYQDLPKKLESEKVDPRIPWLYNFKLDFRFK